MRNPDSYEIEATVFGRPERRRLISVEVDAVKRLDTHPDDEEHLVVIADGNDQSVVVPLDVEDNAFRRNNTRQTVLVDLTVKTIGHITPYR
jgi:hypothetical protein